MTSLIFGFDYIFDFYLFQQMLLCSALGLYLRLLISIISHQQWLKNYSQYFIFSILPITGFIITSVISNNIALSLGMVGALSIVRFRTPVKNPAELVIYFVLITLGIVVNVSSNIALNFILFVTLVIVGTEIYYFLVKKLNLNIFSYDNEEYYYLNITSKMRNTLAEENKELIHFSMQDGNTSMYRFKSTSLASVKFIEELFDAKNIISISIDAPTN
jgi:hypothetical protein